MSRRTKIILLIILLFICVIFLKPLYNLGRGGRYGWGGNYIGSDPSFSPDGNKIVFGSLRYWFSLGDICIINSDGSNWRRLTGTWSYEGEPSFSPDGKKIVFISERDGNGEIYIMNADGTNQTRLTYTDFYEFNPSFSPDGSKIIFTRMLNKKPKSWDDSEIFVMNLDGSDERRITYNKFAENNPRFFSDGKKIYYSINNNNEREEIWTINLDGSKPIRLLEMPEKAGNPVFSPDGQKIVFLSWRETDYAVDPNTKMEIYIMNADGSNPKQLTYTKRFKSSVNFSPVGLKIIFLEEELDGRGKGQICVMNSDGSNLTVISNNY